MTELLMAESGTSVVTQELLSRLIFSRVANPAK